MPLNSSRNTGFMITRFISCIAAVASAAGRRARAGMTATENAM